MVRMVLQGVKHVTALGIANALNILEKLFLRELARQMLIKVCQRAIFGNFSSESGLPGTL